MKIFIATLFVLAAAVSAKNIDVEDPIDISDGSVNNYHTDIGIPLANEIRTAEAEQRSSRIVSGFPASLGQFPYQAGIIVDLVSRHQSVCGGAIITTLKVLTAAHCWWNRNDQAWRLTVVGGSLTLFSGGLRRVTSAVVMHGAYNPDNNQNNIAVVYVGTAFTVSVSLAAIARPTGTELQEDFVDVIATTSGYGLRRDDSVIGSDQFLSFANVHVINNTECLKSFPYSIRPSHICTVGGLNGGSICTGDAGSPLVVMRENRRILVGIASLIPSSGCQLGYANGFQRITYYDDWIRSLP